MIAIFLACKLPDALPSRVPVYEFSCDEVTCHDPAVISWSDDGTVTCEWECVESPGESGESVYASYTFRKDSETGCVEIYNYWENSEQDGCEEW